VTRPRRASRRSCTPSSTIPGQPASSTWVENGGQQAAPAHLLLNLAIGGSWAGRYGIDAAGFPTSLDVDWIRVYRRG
jgi:hypothetical protein